MSRRPGGYRSSGPEFARGLSLAFEFAGAVFLFWLIGLGIDHWLGIEPAGQIVGSLIGWAGGFLHVYYATKPSGSGQSAAGTTRPRGSKPSGNDGGDNRSDGKDSKGTGVTA